LLEEKAALTTFELRILSTNCRDHSKLCAIDWWFGASVGQRSLPAGKSARVPRTCRRECARHCSFEITRTDVDADRDNVMPCTSKYGVMSAITYRIMALCSSRSMPRRKRRPRSDHDAASGIDRACPQRFLSHLRD